MKSRAKRIVQISTGAGYSGSSKFAILSSSGLKALGHEVTLLASENSVTSRRGQQAGLDVRILPEENDRKENYYVFESLLEDLRPEFAIAHDSIERKYLMRFRRRKGKRVFSVAFRSIVPSSFPIVSSIPYNLWLDMQVACSKGVAKSLVWRGVLPSKVKVVYNGIDIYEEAPLPLSKESLGVQNDAFIIGMSAWFHPTRKGFDILFSALANGFPRPYSIMMLGVPAQRKPDILAMAHCYGVSGDHFIFPGFIDDIWPYYASMDVFVLPSRKEGFSLALLEAMAVGLPVIASDIPGNNEAVKNGETGILFPLHRPKSLLDALITVQANKEFAEQIGTAAKELVRTKYTYAKVSKDLDQVLEQLGSTR